MQREQIEQAEVYAQGYERGRAIASARAESRLRLGLPLAYGEDCDRTPTEDDGA